MKVKFGDHIKLTHQASSSNPEPPKNTNGTLTGYVIGVCDFNAPDACHKWSGASSAFVLSVYSYPAENFIMRVMKADRDWLTSEYGHGVYWDVEILSAGESDE